jgi:hypothetical protein
MANGDQQGILPLLGMQNQQPQGLLGALGDPETMAYIGMMLKGLSPYSNIDPNSMLANAHTNALRKEALRQQMAERATDNQRADARLDLDRQRFGLTQREYDEQKAQAEREQKAREDFYSGRSGATSSTLDPTTTPDATTPPSEVSKYDEIRKQIKYYEDNMGKLGQKDQIAAQKQIDVLKKRLEPSATELKQYDTSSGNLPQLESLKEGLERAKELVPQAAGSALGTYANKMAAWIGSRRPEVLATVELDRKMQELALTELKKLLPGPASNRDVDIIRGIASDPAMPPDEKSRRIEGVLTRVEAQIAKERGTVKRFQQKEGTYKPEEDAGGGGLPGGWTVKVK